MVFTWKPQIGNELEGTLEKVRCPESEVPRADSNQESPLSNASLPNFLPIKWGSNRLVTPGGHRDDLWGTGVR